MPKVLFLIATVALFTGVAQASYTTCAGPSLYSSDIRVDMGIPPRPCQIVGTTVIVYEGTVLVNRENISGLGLHTPSPYNVILEGKKHVLKKTGNAVSGKEMFEQLAVLHAIDSVSPSRSKEIARESVVCTRTWARVP